jgi:hypothetical protein
MGDVPYYHLELERLKVKIPSELGREWNSYETFLKNTKTIKQFREYIEYLLNEKRIEMWNEFFAYPKTHKNVLRKFKREVRELFWLLGRVAEHLNRYWYHCAESAVYYVAAFREIRDREHESNGALYNNPEEWICCPGPDDVLDNPEAKLCCPCYFF